MKNSLILSLLLAAGVGCTLTMPSCATAPSTVEGKMKIEDEADAAIARGKRNDPTLANAMSGTVGYAVFPTIGKGGIGVGGAYGKGVVYDGGLIVGYCDMSQASIGLQLGGQSYTEIILFSTRDALNTFKAGNFAFDAQATAVALRSGAGANAKFTRGVAVLTMDEAGLMGEAVIGGQKFSYQPK